MRLGHLILQKRTAAALCVALSLLAVLLWGRLKLVTAAPRTAYADPESKHPVPAWRRAAGQPAQERQPK